MSGTTSAVEYVIHADEHGDLDAAVRYWRKAVDDVQEARRLVRFGAGALIEGWAGATAESAVGQLVRLAGQLDAAVPLLEASCSSTSAAADRLADVRTRARGLAVRLAAAREQRDTEMRLADVAPVLDPSRGFVTAESRRREAEAALAAEEAELTRRFRDLQDEARAVVQQWLRDLREATPTRSGEGTGELLTGLTATAQQVQRGIAVEQAGLLADRLLAAGGDATVADLADLQRLLDTWAEDPEFAAALLLDLGPQRLLDLTSGVVLAYHGSHRPGRTPIDAAVVGSLQQALGRLLAAGSRNLGNGPGQLPQEWLAGLLAAGRRHGRFLDSSCEVYGYQWLGVLLGTGSYGREFLLTVGRDMLAVEREVLAGRDAALRALPSGLPWGGPATLPPVYPRLDFTGGTGGDAPLGYDPVRNLMVALARDPETARQFLATDMWQGQAPALDYLVTDRVWTLDESLLGRDPGGAVPNEGLLALGETLRVATTVDADDRSWQLVRALVQAVYDDEQAQGFLNGGAGGLHAGVFGQVEIVPPELRDALSRITVAYLPAFHNALAGESLFDAAPLVPSAQVGDTDQLAQDSARLFLAELGRDPVSYERISNATVMGLRDLYQQAPAGWTAEQMTQSLTRPGASMLATLDYGAMQQRWAQMLVQDAELTADYAARYRAMGGVVSAVTGAVPGSPAVTLPFAVAGELVGDWTASTAPTADLTGLVNWLNGRFQTAGEQRANDAVSLAEYERFPVERLDPVLVEDGERVPMSRWNDTQADAWKATCSIHGGDPDVNVRLSVARDAYRSAINDAKSILAQHDPHG